VLVLDFLDLRQDALSLVITWRTVQKSHKRANSLWNSILAHLLAGASLLKIKKYPHTFLHEGISFTYCCANTSSSEVKPIGISVVSIVNLITSISFL